MNVCDYLLDGKPGSSVALLTLRTRHTYAELQSAARSVAAFLVKSGGRKGDRAFLLAESDFFWAAAYLGIIRAGLICIPLPSKLPPEDLQYILGITGPKFAFIESRFAAKVTAQWDAIEIITDFPVCVRGHSWPVTLAALQNAADLGSRSLPEVDLDDLAALMFTSGSTGRPRGVMVSNRNIIANTDSIIQCLSLTSLDRIMAVLPFHYCFGTSLLHTHLRVGGCVVTDPRFLYPEAVLQRMKETSCTGFAGVPSHFQILLRRSSLARMELPDLRYVQQAGGPMAPAFVRELRKALPGKQVFIMYGQTEATARLSYLPPELLDTKLGSVGNGMPGVRLSVINDSGLPVAPGEMGEIVAEGDNVGRGYWRDEEESARCFRDGKLYTGDLARVDEDGFIYIIDRAKDFLKCGGERVSCRYLEDILLENTALREAAVIGVPDEVLGEAVVAYIVARDPKTTPTSEQLGIFCRQRLPLRFVPKRFVMLSRLPRSSSGKVMKTVLQSELVAASCN